MIQGIIDEMLAVIWIAMLNLQIGDQENMGVMAEVCIPRVLLFKNVAI